MTLPIIRTSERKDFKRCQARWWWHYREGLKPRGSEKTPLWFGTGIHLALAEWYLPGLERGVHPAETFAKFAKDGIHSIKTADATDEAVAQYEDSLDLGIAMLDGYIRQYGRDEHMDIIQAEHPFGLDIPWPDATRQKAYIVDPGDIMALYRGTWDGVYRDLTSMKVKLLETKTAKAISTAHLSLDDQAGSYWAIATMVLRKLGLLGPRERIHGIEYNFLRKALPDDRPKDAEGYACNKPVKADYVAAIEAERMKMPAPGPAGSWLGPPLTGKESLSLLGDIANKMELTVLGERSKVQSKPLFERHTVTRTSPEQRSQLRRIQDEAVQMQLVRDGTVAPTKNPTNDCSWDCDFFAMCELQDRGGEWEDFKRIAYRVADPYADHRKSAED
jgi:PD-(D/E)XK nuclease superfamily